MRRHDHRQKSALCVAFCVLLAACASRPTAPVREPAHPTVLVTYGPETMEVAGWCAMFQEREQLIQIRPGMGKEKTHRVVAHELYHAAGFREHSRSRECYSYAAAGSTLPDAPCPEEVMRLRQVPPGLRVSVKALDEGLHRPTAWAAWMWNDAIGRTVFVVVP